MESGRKVSKKKLIGVVSVFVILFYPLAVFIRAEAVPFYANTFYRSNINKVFTLSFSGINQKLESLGFTFSPAASTCYNGISDSGNAWYHGASETVLCTTETDSNSVVASSQFKTQWPQAISQLQSELSGSGFLTDKADYNNTPDTALSNIFDAYNQGVSFRKNIKNVTCEFRLDYGSLSGQPNSSYIIEKCQRYVSFFGGSHG